MANITVTAFIFHGDKMLFVFHRKMRTWMHVGGHVEEGELFDDALRREIREEVGLEVDILDMRRMPSVPLTPMAMPFFLHGDADHSIAIDYLCRVRGDPTVRLQQSELGAFKWVRREELQGLDTLPALRELASLAFDAYCEMGSPCSPQK